jgi:hypothetical protein
MFNEIPDHNDLIVEACHIMRNLLSEKETPHPSTTDPEYQANATKYARSIANKYAPGMDGDMEHYAAVKKKYQHYNPPSERSSTNETLRPRTRQGPNKPPESQTHPANKT